MSPFKAYDIRGVYGAEVNEELAYKIGRHLPALLGGSRALVGRDARLSSPSLAEALLKGLSDSGCDTDFMGLASTPLVYFATAEFNFDFSVQITASHNPADCNGFKISRRGALPVGVDTGLAELERLCAGPTPPPAAERGTISERNYLPVFLKFLHRDDFSGMKIVVDCSNGMGALTARDIFASADASFIADEIDGSFPSHAPNPLEAAAREPLRRAVLERGADLGVIFDGDADRVMFVDERGEFVRPDLMIAPIADCCLARQPGSYVVHDIRTSRAVSEHLAERGAKPFIWKVGHAFAKLKLRELDAICGGEFAGHYYFKDFHWCDSGELASVLALTSFARAKMNSGLTFSEFMAPLSRYACSGELNFRIADKDAAIARVLAAVEAEAKPVRVLDFDGFRLDFPDWWFNIRKSNTEPYLRLIVEASGRDRLEERVAFLKGLIGVDEAKG